MKKTFVTLTLFVAMALAANATNRQQDQAAVKQTALRTSERGKRQTYHPLLRR